MLFRSRGTTRYVWLVGAVVEDIPGLYASLEQWEEQRAEAEKAITFERNRALARRVLARGTEQGTGQHRF